MRFTNLRANVATQRQRLLLKDLLILCGKGIPNRITEEYWERMTKQEAAAEIQGWYRELGRFDAYEGPEPDDEDEEWLALSKDGKAFVDSGCDPYFKFAEYVRSTT